MAVIKVISNCKVQDFIIKYARNFIYELKAKMLKHTDGYTYIRTKWFVERILTTLASARMQSQSGSIHSPHRIRKIIMNEWKKSVKFHLKKISFLSLIYCSLKRLNKIYFLGFLFICKGKTASLMSSGLLINSIFS